MTYPAGVATPPSASAPKPPTQRKKTSFLQMEITPAKVKRDELMHLSRQLGAFVHAGLPLIEAVQILAEEARSTTLRKALVEIGDGLRRGETLSDCLDRHPKIFPEYYRGIMRSAELTGRLDVVLAQLAAYLERDLEARRKLTSAMIYPLVIAGASVGTVVILAWFVLPKFKAFFENLDAELPLTTRILLGITDFLANYWWLVVGVLAAVVLLTALIVRTPGGRYARDRFLLGLPLIGETIRIALVERFCRVLASMAAAGVALPTALRVATDSLRNRVFMKQLAHVGDEMMRGEGLAGPLTAVRIFPPTAARMIRVGEETGTLDAQLETTARYYEGELDHRLKKITAFFEPAVIIGMGLVVGFVAVAMVQAMYGIFNQVDI
jgi:type IV pilus assembly protein PilC